ncbi:hypothetical protein GCM10009798_06710 [Nocardioides panacihumi]|uniref:HTH marR-type domain-containing protein n=1 Tax=Nocardioides panacihumi TaxID=400774 RepID=A0ABP5BPS4_9ACTN
MRTHKSWYPAVMPTDLSDTWGALLKVHAALVPRVDRELQEAHGLPLTWYDVLLELNGAPDGRLTMGQLGSVAAVSRTRVSRVVDELTRAGLVTREPNPEDGRSAFAALTPPAGRRCERQRPRTSPWCDASSPTISAPARPRSWRGHCARCLPPGRRGGERSPPVVRRRPER